jgi:hypothetical protein
MGSHPINLAFRFLLELSLLGASGFWGWMQSDTWIRFILVIGIPVLLGAIWGVFAVPGDPSRSGSAPIAVPGIIRLIIELAMFSFAIWALYDLGFTRMCIIFGTLVGIHYMISYDRILWLLRH